MPTIHREQLLHALYEAAELEHNLMCTYLYAAWSIKERGDEGVDEARHAQLAEWKQTIMRVAIEEMSHLVSVWNITSALGGAPRVGRYNFPLPPGALPASLNVRLAPFTRATLQHFIFLERPGDSAEADGAGFGATGVFLRGNAAARHTPMPDDYLTVGEFYASLKMQLDAFVRSRGEALAFSGQRGLQIAGIEFGLPKAKTVICAKTAQQAFDAIVAEGEGAPSETRDSHYCRFLTIRDGLDELER
ncbi:MAG: ferritin-like domain-containing protein, partial [Steroidobacteraceae bacterium]